MFCYYFKAFDSIKLNTLFFHFSYVIATLVMIDYFHPISLHHWVDFLLIVGVIGSQPSFDQIL